MKKICLILIFVLFLGSCGKKEPSCFELYKTLSIEGEALEVYPYRSDLINAPFLSRLYDGKQREEYPLEFAYCDDYYVVLGSGTDLFEIHIFHVLSTYNLDAVSNMLQKRRDRLQRECSSGFYSDTTLDRIDAATVFSVDRYVVLCITDDNELIKNQLSSAI